MKTKKSEEQTAVAKNNRKANKSGKIKAPRAVVEKEIMEKNGVPTAMSKAAVKRREKSLAAPLPNEPLSPEAAEIIDNLPPIAELGSAAIATGESPTEAAIDNESGLTTELEYSTDAGETWQAADDLPVIERKNEPESGESSASADFDSTELGNGLSEGENVALAEVQAANAALVAATEHLSSPAGAVALERIKTTRDTTMNIRRLTAEESARLVEYESNIESGLHRYLSIGKYLFAIHSEGLHLGEHKTWREYVEWRWKMSASGAFDLISSYRTWEMTAKLPQAPELQQIALAAAPLEDDVTNGVITSGAIQSGLVSGENLSDADAPSQRAVDELARLSAHLDKGDMSEAEFKEWEAVATRALYEFVRSTAVGAVTQKSIRDATEALIEIVKLQAVEIEGEHRSINAAEIHITRQQFEGIMSDKQRIFEMLEARRLNLSKPLLSAGNTELSGNPDERTLATICSKHDSQPIYKIMHGSIQLLCACVYGMKRDSRLMRFDARLTESNPITDDERDKYLTEAV